MVGKLKTIVWDAPDIRALADFYVGVVGLTQHCGDDEWVTLYSPDGWRFGVQRAPDHVPPRWPDPAPRRRRGPFPRRWRNTCGSTGASAPPFRP